MNQRLKFSDIHCHLLPGIDDGANDLNEALGMAKLAVEDGISEIVVTPHQLGNFAKNDGETIRAQVREMQECLDQHQIPLKIFPGGDVRIEEGMIEQIQTGRVLTLADRRKHILLELPHELYYAIDGLVDQLASIGIQSILSHPERNQGILRNPDVVADLVAGGCLMQVTAGSLVGTFGPKCQSLAESLLSHGHVHFLATDAHGLRARRPLMSRAFQRASDLVGTEAAIEICQENPRAVVRGNHIELRRKHIRQPSKRTAPKRSWLQRLVSA